MSAVQIIAPVEKRQSVNENENTKTFSIFRAKQMTSLTEERREEGCVQKQIPSSVRVKPVELLDQEVLRSLKWELM